MRITHSAYKAVEIKITAPREGDELQLPEIVMHERLNEIEEVVLSLPPLYMKNDTLIINPSGFKLKKNSVVEDLLTKVPGIVIWADGKITINGKVVPNVLVDGKPFMGGEIIVATRNIPNEAIKHVKVYEKNASEDDDRMEIDIVLKKKQGLFGNISLGYGTNHRKEGMATINYFNRKHQYSAVWGRNNLNKEANSVGTFLMSSVYKPGGNDLAAFRSSFIELGDNTFNFYGIRVHSFWKPDLETEMEGFYLRKDKLLLQNKLEDRYFEGEKTQQVREENKNEGLNKVLSFKGNTKYEFKNLGLSLNLSGNSRLMEQVNQQMRDVKDKNDVLVSNSNTENKARNQSNALFLQSKWTVPSRLNLDYDFSYSDSHVEQDRSIMFKSIVQNNSESIHRLEELRTVNFSHFITNSLNIRYIKGKRDFLPNLSWNNKLNLKHGNSDQLVKNLDLNNSEHFNINSWLTYNENQFATNWETSLDVLWFISNNYSRGFKSNRFAIGLDYLLLGQSNNSTQKERQLEKYFIKFIPSLGYSYSKKEMQLQNDFDFKYQRRYLMPSLHDFVALVDSSNYSFNDKGNIRLVPELNDQFEVKLKLSKPLKKFYHIITVTYLIRKNQLVDSVFFDVNGQGLAYKVNAIGKPKLKLNYTANFSKVISGNPTVFTLLSEITHEKRMAFQNGKSNLLSSNLFFSFFTAEMTISDYLKLNIKDTFIKSFYKDEIRNFGMLNNNLGMDVVSNWPKGFTWVNSMNLLSQRSTGFSQTNQFIANSALSYRMLKKDQLELKLSVYDLFHQRRNIENVLNANYIRNTNTNNLERSIMLSLNYFIQKF
ncbi:outer membrane beta-barrel protein [Sphingobacterium kyonggiense]